MVFQTNMKPEREEGTTRGSLAPDDAHPTERGVSHLDESTMSIAEPPPLPPRSSPPEIPAPRATDVRPKLSLVPSPDSETSGKAIWPFAEEDPSSLVKSGSNSAVRRPTGSLRPPSRVVDRFGPRSKNAAPTMAKHARHFPLPPPTEFGDADLNLRRDESVIAEAQHVKSETLWRVQGYARRASSMMSDRGYALATSLGEQSVAAIRRFESLPRKKQLVWVAAPYALAIVLVVVLLQVRSGAPQAATAPIAPIAPATTAVVPTNLVAPAASTAEALDVPLVPPRRHVEAKPAESDAPDVGAGVERTVPVQTRLFARPKPGPHTAKLRKGAKITVFPDFPAPDGFMLAQSGKGTVGFISVLHLEGERDPSIDRPKKKRRHRRGRRR